MHIRCEHRYGGKLWGTAQRRRAYKTLFESLAGYVGGVFERDHYENYHFNNLRFQSINNEIRIDGKKAMLPKFMIFMNYRNMKDKTLLFATPMAINAIVIIGAIAIQATNIDPHFIIMFYFQRKGLFIYFLWYNKSRKDMVLF
ncbi:MAG TPA: hypothetical protein VFC70_01370 [Oscillospiraceae bacterium]|nr:hypothetical protein [Oscillospiraceae bacterium]